MNKHLHFALATMLGLLCLTACHKEENGVSHKSFRATTQRNDIKTTLHNGTDIYWTDRDAIDMIGVSHNSYGTFYTDNNDFLEITGINCNYATFEGNVTATSVRYIALYPDDEFAASLDRGMTGITTYLPSSQEATDNSFSQKANIMVASCAANGDNLAFKNVCAYIKVTSPYNCKSIQLISNGSRLISGKFNVDVATDGTPSNITPLSEEEGGSRYVRLTGNIRAGSVYYIAILPGVLDGGFTIKFWGKEGDEDLHLTNSQGQSVPTIRAYRSQVGVSYTFEANHVYTLSQFTNTPEDHIIPEGSHDLQLPSGTLWASCNLGASDSTDYGLYYQLYSTTGYPRETTTFPSGTAYTGTYCDMANHALGDPWVTPTRAQYQELINCCEWIYDSRTNATLGTVYGYEVQGPNETSIFLPAAGAFITSYWRSTDYYGNTMNRYWTLSAGETSSTSTNHYYLSFTSNHSSIRLSMDNSTLYGYPVRPVVNEDLISAK